MKTFPLVTWLNKLMQNSSLRFRFSQHILYEEVNTNISAVEVVLDQRSGEWHQYRAKRIGASDAPIICGLSPWKSAIQLWMEKTGKITQPDSSGNFAIQRGIRLEPVVRAMASLILDRDFIVKTFMPGT